MRSGIYFLLKGKKVVYIGQTARFPLRFNTINGQYDFNRIRFIECNERDLLSYESRWIKLFKPEYNQIHNPGKYRSPMLGKPNPTAGRLVGSSPLDKLDVGDEIPYKGSYSPSIRIAYFNKTRAPKELIIVRRDNKPFIYRIQ